jgi:CheY-like chemotaxis protein
MSWIKLVHWSAAEAEPRARLLESLGYTVNFEQLAGLDFLKAWREDPPAAVVIDLSRVPSHGREIGMAIRHTKATRAIPLVFAGGEPEKVVRTRGLLPDAVYTNWEELSDALRRAIENPVLEPITPKTLFDAYAGQPLTKKLGIRPGMRVQLIGAPPDFAQVLGELPQGVSLHEEGETQASMILCFVRSSQELLENFQQASIRQDFRFLWVAWPKKASGVKTDLTQQLVRETGLAQGLVDFKICSIDSTWSGLCFTRRK